MEPKKTQFNPIQGRSAVPIIKVEKKISNDTISIFPIANTSFGSGNTDLKMLKDFLIQSDKRENSSILLIGGIFDYNTYFERINEEISNSINTFLEKLDENFQEIEEEEKNKDAADDYDFFPQFRQQPSNEKAKTPAQIKKEALKKTLKENFPDEKFYTGNMSEIKQIIKKSTIKKIKEGKIVFDFEKAATAFFWDHRDKIDLILRGKKEIEVEKKFGFDPAEKLAKLLNLEEKYKYDAAEISYITKDGNVLPALVLNSHLEMFNKNSNKVKNIDTKIRATINSLNDNFRLKSVLTIISGDIDYIRILDQKNFKEGNSLKGVTRRIIAVPSWNNHSGKGEFISENKTYPHQAHKIINAYFNPYPQFKDEQFIPSYPPSIRNVNTDLYSFLEDANKINKLNSKKR